MKMLNVKVLVRHHIWSLSIVVIAFALFAFGMLALNQEDQTVAKLVQSNQTQQATQIKSITDDRAAKIAKEKADKAAAAKQKELASKASPPSTAKQSSTSAKSTTPKHCNQGGGHNNPAALDIIVNKKHCIEPLHFVPPDLVTSHGATMRAIARSDFNRMYSAASKAGYKFSVTSSYRSYQTQVSTYNYWVRQSGVSGADRYSARPGFSEHQTGLSFDLASKGCGLSCFAKTGSYKWLKKHAADYGFIQRYPSGYENITGYSTEQWHYRYVGASVARDMKARGIKTLEQYWGVSGGGY